MKQALDAALGAARRGSAVAAMAGGALILGAAVLVSVDVLLRKFARVTLGGADELSGYALAIGATWSFAYVLLNRGNVRIDALYQHLPKVAAAICDVLAVAALLGFVSVVTWYGFGVLSESWRINAHSNSALAVPLFVPQALWWLGYAGFVICAVLQLARALLPLLAGDWDGVGSLIGARSIQEDAAEEVASALQASGAKAAP